MMNLNYLRTLRTSDLIDHRLSELSGIVQGIVIGGSRNAHGLYALARWIETAEELHDVWPVTRWRESITWILWDRNPNPNQVENTWRSVDRDSGQLVERTRRFGLRPLASYDDPPPDIIFEERIFVFTGLFETCNRGDHEMGDLAQAATEALGGVVHPRPILKAHYLVVGTRANPAWKRSRYGRKIEQVEKWREAQKTSCAIVAEEHWAQAVWNQGQLRREKQDLRG